jgi:hypothetical protein
MGKEYADLITCFDRMRNKGNQAIYDVAGLISEREARDLLRRATESVHMVRVKLRGTPDVQQNQRPQRPLSGQVSCFSDQLDTPRGDGYS